jgi:hypothetical protein
MTARILQFPGTVAQSERANLLVVEDEFSAKVETDADKLFWVRVEKDFSDTIVVSDFIRGGLAEKDLIRALQLAVAASGAADRSKIVFKDLVSAAAEGAQFGFKLEQATEAIKRACSALALANRRKLASFKIAPRGRKMDAQASFS